MQEQSISMRTVQEAKEKLDRELQPPVDDSFMSVTKGNETWFIHGAGKRN